MLDVSVVCSFSFIHFFGKYYLDYFFIFILYILFLAALGLCTCVWAFSSCSEQGLLFVVVCRLLVVVDSLVAEHGL